MSRTIVTAVLFLSAVASAAPTVPEWRVVADATGSPIAGAAIEIRPYAGGTAVKASTDAEGRIQVGAPLEGSYLIDVRAPGFARTTSGPHSLSQQIRGLSGGVVRLAPEAIVRGVVTAEGRPAAGASVSIGPAAVRTSGDGRFEVRGLAAGRHWAWVQTAGYMGQGRQVVVAAGEAKDEAFQLAPMRSVWGRILTPDGRPFPRVSVYTQNGPSYGSTVTDAEGRFRVKGLQIGTYSLRLYGEGIDTQTVDGFDTEAAQGRDLVVEPLAPRIHLVGNRHVFTPAEKVTVGLRAFRVDRVRLEVHAIPRERLFDASGRFVPPSGFVASDPLTYAKDLAIAYQRPYSFKHENVVLPIKAPGAYVVTAYGPSGPESVAVVVSDLGLVVKRAPGEVLAWAIHLGSGAPYAGAEVRLTGAAGKLTEGRAGADGLFRAAAAPGDAITVTATADGQIASVSAPMAAAAGGQLKAYVYTDRPAYRPGQEVFYKAIVRREIEEGHAVPSGQPVALRVRDSQGQVVHQAESVLSAMGSASGHFTLADEPALGLYTLEVELQGETGQGQFKVLEYRKPEFTVEVSTDRPSYGGGEVARLHIGGRYHFGAPLAGMQAQWIVYATPFIADADGYAWGGEDYDGGYGQLVASDVATLGPDGGADVTFVIPSLVTDMRLSIEAVVTDGSNRSVTGRGSCLATRADFALSARAGSWVYEPGQDALVIAQAQTFDGQPVGTVVDMSVTRRSWSSTTRGYSDDVVRRESVGTDADGFARLAVPGLREGYYRVEATARDAHGRLIAEQAWFWVAGANFGGVSEQVGALQIVTDRRSYEPGSVVRAVIQGVPPDASVLVTTERDSIRSVEVRKARGTMLVVEVPLGLADAPNVFLAASAVRAGTHHVHAVSVRVDARERALSVEVRPDRESYRPGDTATVDLQVRDALGRPVAAELSLGVVDEAIYGISEELAPDIHGFFHGPRPNRVATVYSFSERLLGGADKDAKSRARRNFKDTAFWAPSLQTDVSGHARVTFAWPDNLTTWRFTARAVTADTAAGWTKVKALVSKELVARIHAPRFFTDGDAARVDVVVNDRSGRPRRIQATLEVEGPAAIDGLPTAGFELEAGGEGRTGWLLRATGPGPLRLRARVKDLAGASARSEDNEDALEIGVPVQAFGRPFSVSATAEMDSDAPRDMSLHVPDGAVPGSIKAQVTVNPSVASAAFSSLDDLIGYPYGCAEQTMSRFLPTVIAAEVAASMGASLGAKTAEVPKMVAKGTERLYGYQHADGGWGWWKDDATHPYMTAYVTWGLWNAKKAGFPVEAERLERGLQATAAQLASASDPNVKAFMLHALAAAGRADRNVAVALFAERAKLSDYGRGLLLGVLPAVGERERAAQLRQELEVRANLGGAVPGGPGLAHWEAETWNEGWMKNPVEATAYALKGLVADGASSPMASQAARWLLMNRKGTGWHSTKDTATAVYALLDYTKASEPAPDARVRMKLDGRKAHEVSFRGFGDLGGPPIPLAIRDAGDHRLTVERTGQGRIFLAARVSGVVAQDSIGAEGTTLSVTRRYFLAEQMPDGPGRMRIDRRPLAGALPAGSLVQVELTVRAAADAEFVMVEDPLPAGFEVVAEPEAVAACEECDVERPYDRREERDEKIAFFKTALPAGEWTLTYLAKAEVPGRLRVLPTRVEAMYTPGVEGHGASEAIEVLPR